MYSAAGDMRLENAPECRGTVLGRPAIRCRCVANCAENGPAATESIGVTSGLVKLDSSGIGNLSFNSILALGFEWGIRLQPREFSGIFKGGWEREITLMWAGGCSKMSPHSRR
jgi:hypothetical protein